MLFVAGQIGVLPDGSLAQGLAAQADQAFRNLGAVLEAHGMGFADIVKTTLFLVTGQSFADVRAVRLAHLGDHKPASTVVFVPQLLSGDWLLEGEAVAARP
jgi:enamine deaminase RidA (YjgF/YER057c/UK114 family)